LIVLVSNFPGGVALHPAAMLSPSDEIITKNSRTSVHHMQRKGHRSMSRPTEDGTVTNEIARLVRREFQFSGSPFIHLRVEIEFAKAQPVRYVETLNNENDWLALLHCNFGWSVFESLRRYLNSTGKSLRV